MRLFCIVWVLDKHYGCAIVTSTKIKKHARKSASACCYSNAKNGKIYTVESGRLHAAPENQTRYELHLKKKTDSLLILESHQF